jgi:phosphoribosylformylglycinamidine synthase
MRATVFVTLKQDVLDPQGKAIQRASESLGFAGVRAVRQGKLFEIELDAGSPAEAREQLAKLCERLLSNPVIEDWRIERLE